jgi:hypothetical protein
MAGMTVLLRGGLLLTAALAVACGSSAGPGSTATSSTPAPTTTRTPRPPAAPEPVAVAVWHSASPPILALYGADGRALGSVAVPSDGTVFMQAAPGGDGVYFTVQSRIRELLLGGQVRDVGPLPTPAPKGGFAVSPDGRSIAYGVRVGQLDQPTWHNQLWIAPVAGGTPRLLSDRVVSKSNTPPSDAPLVWEYRVLDWTPLGIVVVRGPVGVGGNGPFIDESYDGYSALVDPATGSTTTLTDNSRCPLSTVGADGSAVCFSHGVPPASGVDALVVRAPGGTSRSWSMSGQNAAGWAQMEPATRRLAYATTPPATPVETWQTAAALRLLDMSSGQTKSLGPTGVRPLGWMRDGGILALRYQVGASDAAPFLESLVRLDPVEGTWQTLGSLQAGDSVMGVVTR